MTAAEDNFRQEGQGGLSAAEAARREGRGGRLLQYTMACAKVLRRPVRPMAGTAGRWGCWSSASQGRA